MNSRLWAVMAVFSLLPGALAARATPASGEPLEYRVKAAFLLNFLRFTEWPEDATANHAAPVTICVVGGEDPFGGALEEIVAGEQVGRRPISVQRVTAPAKTCQLVFFPRHTRLAQGWLDGLGPGVLTVGDSPAFLREGGMIGFVVDNRRVRFDVNQAAVQGAGLRLSARLMSVARMVVK